jgi:ubiquinone biosynthesis protein
MDLGRGAFTSIRSYRRVLGVLVKYGFADVLLETGMSDLLGGAVGRRLSPTLLGHSRPERFRMALEELGPTFMKLGQVLSTRRDLLPPEYVDELCRLQTDCPPVAWEDIQARLDAEFAGRAASLFGEIDRTPLAAGTIAQAHAATLPDGRRVVLKVLRPGIHAQVEGDLATLRFLAERLEDAMPDLPIRPTAVIREFARRLRRELDLEVEARSTERLRQAFADDPNVTFPEVFWTQTRKGVLCIERIEGRLLARTDVATLSAETRRAVVEHGTRAVVRMCLEIGFFHADPHPGNLFILDGNRVCFIDCGMTASVSTSTRRSIADLVLAVATKDPAAVMAAAIAIGHVDLSRIDRRALELETQELVDCFVGVPIEQIDVAAVLQQFFDMLRRSGIECPPDIVLLIKAMTTIQGVGRDLDPDFQLIEYARPYVEALVRERYTPKSVGRRLRESLVGWVSMVERLPSDLGDVVSRLRENRLGVSIKLDGIDDFSEAITRAGGQVGYAVLLASLLLSSGVLVLASRIGQSDLLYVLGMLGSLVAFGLTGIYLLSNWRAARSERKRHRKARRGT